MVGFVELTSFEERLKHEHQRPELWVFLHKLLDQLDAVDAVLAIKAQVGVDASLFVLQFDDWDFRVFDRLDG